MRQRQATGNQGEELVAVHLEANGFEIIQRNAKVGRLEIDVIARRGELVVFCEVRTRTSRAFMDPIASIDRQKVARIRSAATQWLRETHTRATELRFDAASVVLEGDSPALTYYESAF